MNSCINLITLRVVDDFERHAARADIILRPLKRAILADHDPRNAVEQGGAAAHVAGRERASRAPRGDSRPAAAGRRFPGNPSRRAESRCLVARGDCGRGRRLGRRSPAPSRWEFRPRPALAGPLRWPFSGTDPGRSNYRVTLTSRAVSGWKFAAAAIILERYPPSGNSTHPDSASDEHTSPSTATPYALACALVRHRCASAGRTAPACDASESCGTRRFRGRGGGRDGLRRQVSARSTCCSCSTSTTR